jgi:hypothetical protein
MINFFKNIPLMKKSKNILFLDIDNTLLTPNNIYIYYNDGKTKIAYTPDEYNKINPNINEKHFFDFSDFRDPHVVKNSIITADPIYRTLNIVDMFTEYNFDIGILTARGAEQIIKNVMPMWLKKNLKNPFKIRKRNIYAINDEYKKYNGYTDSNRKLNVLKRYIKNNNYDNIVFIDDNKNTIDLINDYNKKNKKKKQIHLIHVTWK